MSDNPSTIPYTDCSLCYERILDGESWELVQIGKADVCKFEKAHRKCLDKFFMEGKYGS